jgi:hypothetical protein
MRQRYRIMPQVRPGSNQPSPFTSATIWLVATLAGILFTAGLVAVTRKVVLKAAIHSKGAPDRERPERIAMGKKEARQAGSSVIADVVR